jgi:hypothetical protein
MMNPSSERTVCALWVAIGIGGFFHRVAGFLQEVAHVGLWLNPLLSSLVLRRPQENSQRRGNRCIRPLATRYVYKG